VATAALYERNVSFGRAVKCALALAWLSLLRGLPSHDREESISLLPSTSHHESEQSNVPSFHTVQGAGDNCVESRVEPSQSQTSLVRAVVLPYKVQMQTSHDGQVSNM
jgi:hypothetical protein